ncbi:hypothetical protein FPQ18DRAFT_271458, partial [Pyronema domesticum]
MQLLTMIYADNGKYTEAVELGKATIEAGKEILGPDHPDTLISIHNLGVAYDILKKYAEAEACYQEVLERQVRVLEHEHPYTMKTMHRLIRVLREQNKLEEA